MTATVVSINTQSTVEVAMQHPDLQRVVLATVPLTDMIRFPIFGRGGVSEYGDPDDAEDFKALLSFSPYHRVKEHLEKISEINRELLRRERDKQRKRKRGMKG